jgi:hypothetical protein
MVLGNAQEKKTPEKEERRNAEMREGVISEIEKSGKVETG